MPLCRLCKGKNLQKFLDLGPQPPSDAFLTKEELKEEESRYPLDVYLCLACGQVQLGYVVPPEVLYCKGYPYESSTTRTGREHFYEMAEGIVERFRLGRNDLVVDLGSNVGVLLGGFKAQGTRVLGVDPAAKMAEIANASGIETVTDFFTAALARKIVVKHGPAKAMTATNVFAHIDDLDDTMEGVLTLLAEDGVLVIEAPHFVQLVRNTEYDTIYHEHLSYLSAKPLTHFFGRFGMEIFDAEAINIHGGSLRYFVARREKYPHSESVGKITNEEENEGIHGLPRLRDFAAAVLGQKRLLMELLGKLKKEGRRIAGLSAPAKGNTLLNYCGVTPTILDYITEKAQMKVGLFTPGTHIPVYGDDRLLTEQPDYALILAWNFADEIMKNLAEYKKRGGKFIIPIPRPRIV